MNLQRQRVFLGLITAMLSASIYSCKQSGGFSGDSGRAAARQKPQPQKPIPTVQKPPEEKCTEARLVGVRSLSSFINQSSFSKQFDVELTFEPCPYQTTDLMLPVKFDLDAYVNFLNESNTSIGYEMLVNGASQSNGMLQQKGGSDLFGKFCQDCFFYQTDFPLEASPTLSKAVLRLSLSTLRIMGPSSSTMPATQNFMVPLHVRVGDANPVTGQLTFSPGR